METSWLVDPSLPLVGLVAQHLERTLAALGRR
jgi:hypothetical protein